VRLSARLALRFESLGIRSRDARALGAVAALELKHELEGLAEAARGWAEAERDQARQGVPRFPGVEALRVAELLAERARDEPRCVFCRTAPPVRGSVACSSCHT
jgi:hypothetical protein